MTGPLDRRTLLQLGGIAAFSSLAGCATFKAQLGLRTEELGRVVLANSIDEPVGVTVEVIRDGKTILNSSYQLDPGSSKERPQIVLYKWKKNPTAQDWVIKARTTAGDWQNAVLKASRGGRHDCHRVSIITGDWPEGELLVLPTDCKSP